LVVDAEKIWTRPATGGTWRAQPYAATLRDQYKGEPRHVAVSPDGKLLAVAVNTSAPRTPNHIVLWDLVQNEPGARQTQAAGPTAASQFGASPGRTTANAWLWRRTPVAPWLMHPMGGSSPGCH